MKKSSKIILIILAIIIIASILGGVYFVIKKQQESNNKIDELQNEIVNLTENKVEENNINKNETIVVNEINATSETTSSSENNVTTNNKVTQSQDNYKKYIGTWYDDTGSNEFEIKKIENNKITFTWFLYRLTSIDDATLSLENNKTEFYFQGYDDANYDGNITENEKFIRKASIELQQEKVVITVKEVNSIEDTSKLLEEDGIGDIEEGTYVYYIK